MTSASVRAASPPQPASADDISARVRHGEIDGNQLEFQAMESSVLRGPWPGNRHATLRRGSHERKTVAGYAKSAYLITGKSCATHCDLSFLCNAP
jgi:hypothetical protein